MSVLIKLTDLEFEKACMVGVRRNYDAILKKCEHHFTPTWPWDNHIEAAGSECCVAKYCRIPWNGGRRWVFDEADVGEHIEVRWTAGHGLRLGVRKDEAKKMDRPYVLVTGRLPTMIMRGFIMGRDAMVDAYWDRAMPYPAFMVPQHDLRSMEELKLLYGAPANDNFAAPANDNFGNEVVDAQG